MHRHFRLTPFIVIFMAANGLAANYASAILPLAVPIAVLALACSAILQAGRQSERALARRPVRPQDGAANNELLRLQALIAACRNDDRQDS